MMREDKEVDMKPVLELLSQREGRFARWEYFVFASLKCGKIDHIVTQDVGDSWQNLPRQFTFFRFAIEGTQTAHDAQPAKELESIAWTVRPH